MARSSSSSMQGWGEKIPQYLKDITVVNRAIGGRSARSYWREGRWTSVQNSLKAGDFVLIEFGHNDGGSPRTSDRASVGGEGSETQTVTLADGTVETVYTWPTYVGWMIDGAKSKGATVIISAQTPNNPYENRDTISNSPTRFVTYAKNVAAKKGVPYVDHFASCISLYTKLGKGVTESYFPNDHTHTNDAGANQVAWAFLSGLQCPAAAGVLKQYVNDVGKGAGARC
ncbi:carbohydrate esterase family 12 protein [Rhizoctonia solani]|nr:carbohydrate esterase family 12 protein [Rhizoctonia solani]QRW19967.1 carbohydrate esterase family 12 protein [Rhizoctonia solani]